MDGEFAKASLIFNPLKIIRQKFRAQPIICAQTKDITAMEMLYKKNMPYRDSGEMLLIDKLAIEAASMAGDYWRVMYGRRVRVHCNVELSSFLSSEWIESLACYASDDLVVEIVERHDEIRQAESFEKMCLSAFYLRSMGVKIAIDDISGTSMDESIIRAVKPDIIKVCNKEGLNFVRGIGHKARVVAEMIETEANARTAVSMGVDELQGYWCDRLKEQDFPRELEAPGLNCDGAH